MGIHKRYAGYQSFDYLERGRDFKEFDLIQRENAFDPYEIPLSNEQENRVRSLAEQNILISLHEHPHLFPIDILETRAYEKEARIFTAYKELADSYWDAVFDNFMDGTAMITSKHGWKWSDILYDLGMRL